METALNTSSPGPVLGFVISTTVALWSRAVSSAADTLESPYLPLTGYALVYGGQVEICDTLH